MAKIAGVRLSRAERRVATETLRMLEPMYRHIDGWEAIETAFRLGDEADAELVIDGSDRGDAILALLVIARAEQRKPMGLLAEANALLGMAGFLTLFDDRPAAVGGDDDKIAAMERRIEAMRAELAAMRRRRGG